MANWVARWLGRGPRNRHCYRCPQFIEYGATFRSSVAYPDRLWHTQCWEDMIAASLLWRLDEVVNG